MLLAVCLPVENEKRIGENAPKEREKNDAIIVIHSNGSAFVERWFILKDPKMEMWNIELLRERRFSLIFSYCLISRFISFLLERISTKIIINWALLVWIAGYIDSKYYQLEMNSTTKSLAISQAAVCWYNSGEHTIQPTTT